MQKTILTIVLAMLCLFFKVNAQIISPTITPLKIGDKIPEEIWNLPLQVVNHPEGKKTITLNDLKGKLIILDFWATWCSPCIENFPKMEALQKEFGDKIQILAVTYEDQKKIIDFFASNAGQKYHVTSVVNDRLLKKRFPHKGIPHCIWISPENEVIAITSADEVNRLNIGKVLSGANVNLEIKQDLDASKPLFLSDSYSKNNELLYYSILSKGAHSGLSSGNRVRKSGNIIIGSAITNSEMLSIYEAAMWPLFRKLNDNYNREKLVLEVADPTRINPLLKDPSNKTDLYNYDIIVPEKEASSLYDIMLSDLNHFTSYYGKIEKRRMKCFILLRRGSIDLIKSKGGTPVNTIYNKKPAQLINYPIVNLISALNDMDDFTIPIIDETGFNGNVDLKLSGNFKPSIVKSELQAFGLELIEDYRDINVFVLKDK